MLKVQAKGSLIPDLQTVIAELVANKVASRLLNKDFTIWGKEAESESSIRLGWVSSATDSKRLLAPLNGLKVELSSRGISRNVLCGMGGSSLAPEVITKTFGVNLEVLDSTNPDQVAEVVYEDLEHAVVVVSSKSGSTVETDSQKRIFEEAFKEKGIDPTDRIVIVTDPGSPMEQAAKNDGYRVFNADPTVGGRYSALTAFGLVPSALAGVDIAELLDQAQSASELLSIDASENPGLILGALMARTASSSGFKDKIGIISDNNSLPDFADWAEQLIAESTGKLDKGVLPVVLSSSSFEAKNNLDDLLLTAVSADADFQSPADVLVSGSIGEQFLLWEVATVVAGYLLGINPFDQPDVESAKIAARGMLAEKSKTVEPLFVSEGISVTAQNLEISSSDSVKNSLSKLLMSLGDHGYISVQAYVNRNEPLPLAQLRESLAQATGRPTTLGYGPRFLHSTGQYHKGGPKVGVFLQLIALAEKDLAVPGRDFSFGELITSQAAGDAKVLGDLGRPVLSLTLTNPKHDIDTIIGLIG